MSIDVAALRARFPSLSLAQDGRPFVYFDGPGGTQVPDTVIESVVRYYREMNANHEGAFMTSQRSDEVIAEAHAALADFLGAASPDEIKIGPNMTTLTLHVSRSIGARLEPGDEIVVTSLDHNANIDPWRHMARDRGLLVRTIDARPDDLTLDEASLEAAITSRTRLVAVGYASNAVGTINAVAEIGRRAHDVGAWLYVDAVAWAPHGPIDVRAIDADFLACSTYKFFGPHLGVLYGKADILAGLPTYKLKPASDSFETGTGAYELFGGATEAVDYVAGIGRAAEPAAGEAGGGVTGRRAAIVAGMTAIRAYEMDLWARLERGLREIRGLRLWGIGDPSRRDQRVPTAAVTVEGRDPGDLAAALGRAGIATWNGDFYARDLVERLDLADRGGFLRIGIIHYNSAEEVDRLLEELERIVA
ncbi:MAG TPA: cysteine desulfurase-like protein [Candidatus Limnocylindrales bacterium]|nr:cysteine desulfurase-like protein [Candidatus Limnocylindrales bacterium]